MHEELLNPEKQLERELQRFDWTYRYSDDFRVWSRGESHWNKISKLIPQVKPSIVRRLWKKYADNKVCKCPV